MASSMKDTFVVRLQWRDQADVKDREMFQVLSTRGDRIREIADYRTIGEAVRAAKRFAAGAAG